MKSIHEQVDDSLQASSMMSNDELLYEVAYRVACNLVVSDFEFSRNQVAHTVWNILCWLKQSMRSLIYLKSDFYTIVRHDLELVKFDDLFIQIKLNLNLIFGNKLDQQKEAVRYLEVLLSEINAALYG